MKKYLLIILSVVLLLLTACSSNTTPSVSKTEKSEYQIISADEVKTLLDNKTEFILVDVRTKEEFISAHIPTAINIPNEEIDSTRPELLTDLGSNIVVYCRSGRRSREAANKLISLGYSNVKDLGGINAWPYATVGGDKSGTWLV